MRCAAAGRLDDRMLMTAGFVQWSAASAVEASTHLRFRRLNFGFR